MTGMEEVYERSTFSAVIGLPQQIFSHPLHSSAKFISFSFASLIKHSLWSPDIVSDSEIYINGARVHSFSCSLPRCLWTVSPHTHSCGCQRKRSDVRGHTRTRTPIRCFPWRNSWLGFLVAFSLGTNSLVLISPCSMTCLNTMPQRSAT